MVVATLQTYHYQYSYQCDKWRIQKDGRVVVLTLQTYRYQYHCISVVKRKAQQTPVVSKVVVAWRNLSLSDFLWNWGWCHDGAQSGVACYVCRWRRSSGPVSLVPPMNRVLNEQWGWLMNCWLFLPPRREAGNLWWPPCLESQGFQFDPTFLYLLFCSSA